MANLNTSTSSDFQDELIFHIYGSFQKVLLQLSNSFVSLIVNVPILDNGGFLWVHSEMSKRFRFPRKIRGTENDIQKSRNSAFSAERKGTENVTENEFKLSSQPFGR